MIHRFPEGTVLDIPGSFNNPFRYTPHPLVQKAAQLVMERITSDGLESDFIEGKMLGVLIIEHEGTIGYLSGFSGNAGGKSMISGFVPPVYDLNDPQGHFKIKEAEISEINKEIEALAHSESLESLEKELTAATKGMTEEVNRQKARMSILKRMRDEARSECSEAHDNAVLIRESQFEKAELKRIRTRWETKIREIREKTGEIKRMISELKSRRAMMSDDLQSWIFSQYIIHNGNGESRSIADIFAHEGIIPPGGTGECAAPKLLNHAFIHGYRPVCMGEFWYGDSPDTAVRTHGRFYPSCTSKCGPLLKYMMEGITIAPEDTRHETPVEIHIDEDIIVIEKPSGMPSVPGLDGKESLLDYLKRKYGDPCIEAVHRLDMDTSGIMVFARNPEAGNKLRKQFEEHSIKKTYIARLSPAPEGKILAKGDSGKIEIPLSPDYDERPRQKADTKNGKHARTSYIVKDISPDGSIDIIYHPETGRTHQLRVHSAHIAGLGHPIAGDMLYGGEKTERMQLHALSITFFHPRTETEFIFHSDQLCY